MLDLSFNMIYCMLMFLHRKGEKQDINRAGVIEKQVGESVTLIAVSQKDWNLFNTGRNTYIHRKDRL